MKIIKIGDVDFKFICPNCKTEFEIESKELKKEESGYGYYNGYYIECPLCYRVITLGNETEVVRYAKRREELENDN